MHEKLRNLHLIWNSNQDSSRSIDLLPSSVIFYIETYARSNSLSRLSMLVFRKLLIKILAAF